MRIRSMTATFGPLAGDRLELDSGLNIIEAPNESGKSSWCAFIRAMLYGVDSSERDKKGELAVKSKYPPWSGAPMEGEMELTHGGNNITIRRFAQGRYPMRAFTAVYDDSSERVAGLNSETAGEQLTGVGREVFERSAFIKQSGLTVSSGAELEKRLSSLAASGSEEYSFTDTETLLKKRRNKLGGRAGRIPADEAELERLTRGISDTAGLANEIVRLKTERETVRKDYEAAAADVDMYDRIERKEQFEKQFTAEQRLREAKRREAEAEAALAADGLQITAEDAESFRKLSRRRSEDAERNALKSEMAASPFSGLTPEQAREKLAANPKTEAVRTKPVSAVLLFALAVIFAIVCVVTGKVLWLLPTVIFGVIAFLLLRTARHTAAGAAKPDIPNTSEPALERYCTVYARLAELGEAEQSIDERLERIMTAIGADTFTAAADRIMSLTAQAAECRRERRAAEELQAAIGAGFKGKPYFKAGSIVQPKRSKSEAETAMQSGAARLRGLDAGISRLEGQLEAAGDRADMENRIAELKTRLETDRREYNALGLALEELDAANTELQTQFSPALSKRAGELMSELTGGRYAELYFDRSLSAEARRGEELIPHSVMTLSAGAADQLWLALRLALCELALPAGEPCPIILDDALVAFDEKRMENALELLLRMSEKRQILLFTCHRREAEYLNGRENVRIIHLNGAG